MDFCSVEEIRRRKIYPVNTMLLTEGMSKIGLQGAKRQLVRLGVVKKERHGSIAKATVTVVKKDRAPLFHPPVQICKCRKYSIL